MSYANNKSADQPAHPRSLNSAFVVLYLDSIIPILAISKTSRPKLAFVAEQAGLYVTWLQTPENRFSHDEAQLDDLNCTALLLCYGRDLDVVVVMGML